jgi:hypothetical protein
MTSTPRIAFALGLCALAGCKETVSSDHIKTGGIAMLTEVTARSETDVTVRTELVVGGDESNTYVVLESGDRIYAEANGEREEMQAVDQGVYEASFDAGEKGAEYRVLLRRDDGDSAENSMGTLPAPFDITSDLGTDVLSRMDDDVEITWEPSGESGDMSLEVDDDVGGCIFSDRFDIGGDDGSYVIAAGTLDSTSSSEPEECDVTATVTRERDGTHDRNLDGESWFVLRQVRSTTFASGP